MNSKDLQEIDEASFWLEIIEELKLIRPEKLSLLLTESIELTKIPGASRRTATREIDN